MKERRQGMGGGLHLGLGFGGTERDGRG